MPPTQSAASTRGTPLSPDALACLDTLRQLAAFPFDDDSAPQALAAALEAIRLHYGALLRYDSEGQTLSLFCHQGLTAQAVEAIRVIRRGVSGVWDMPLHAVLQRRVYLIEKPKENPFVPVLLDEEQGVLTNVAVLPLFSGGSVTGALLLVGSGMHAIHESDIMTLREHAKMLGNGLRRPTKTGALPARVAVPPIPGPSPAPADARERALLNARINELESLVESLRRSAEEGANAAETERRLAEVTRERDRLKSDNALHEIALRNLKSEHELFRDQTANEAERARKTALELARAKEELTGAQESRQRSSHDLEQAKRSYTDFEARLTALQQELNDTTGQLRSVESARAELASRLLAVETETTEVRKSLRAREEQISDLRAERERLTASLQNAVFRYQAAEDSLSQLRESSDQAVRELRGQAESLTGRLDAAERERDQLSAGIAGRAEIIREIERETEKFRAELAHEAERRRVAEETAKSVIHDAAAFQAEGDRIQAERDAAHAEAQRLRLEAQRLEATLDALRKTSQSDAERLETMLGRLRQRAEGAEAARSALAAEVERLHPDLASLRNREAELRARDVARDEAERQLRGEVAELRQSLQSTTEAARSAARERDALAARAGSLQETTANLLRDGESNRAEIERREQEIQDLRATVDSGREEIERARGELEGLRSEARRAQGELAQVGNARAAEAERAQGLEVELGELRGELERSQGHGSELTAEIERRAQLEHELQATATKLRIDLGERDQRVREEEGERKILQERMEDMQQALQGARTDLADKAREIDFIAVLRATLGKSENARRAAEAVSAGLEAALETERQVAERARAEFESERENARELVGRVEDLERRLRDSEESTAEANHRAALQAAEQAAAQEAARQLAADLGRRTGELGEISSRLESAERELGDRERAAQESLRRTQELEAVSRNAAADIESLKRQASAGQEEMQRRVHELETRMSEATNRADRLTTELRTAEEEQRRLTEAARSFAVERQRTSDAQRESAIKTAELETAVHRGRSEIDRLSSDLESARQRAAALEHDLSNVEAESGRWRGLAEKLQQTLDQRDREARFQHPPPPPVVVEPPAAGAAAPSAAAPPAATPPAAAPPAAAPSATTPAAVAPPAAAKTGTARPGAPTTKSATVVPRIPMALVSRTIVVLDDPGPTFNSIAEICAKAGFEAKALENGGTPAETPAFTAVNLLGSPAGGFPGLLRSRADETLTGSHLVLYAARPGSPKGVVFPHVECLIRPIEEKEFAAALSALLGSGKRVTIIGEELDSVLKLNGWATAKGCSVSSAGDLKQGNEILDIVKPDLLVFDFSRMGGEGAGLVIKARRTSRLETLPMLLVLPPGVQSPSSGFFLKRLATLAEETPLDFAPLARRLAAIVKG